MFLRLQCMSKENSKIERHPFKPFLPPGCLVVMCGTFPPKPDKWAMDFFYPNFQNDMWRVFGLIFFNNPLHFYDSKAKTIDRAAIENLLTSKRVGVGETATEVIRRMDNASDKFLEIVTPVDLPRLLAQVPECRVIATTGEKAASVIADLTATYLPKMGEKVECECRMPGGELRRFLHWRLPSTSRAYPMKLERKAEYYGSMLRYLGII